MPVPCETKHTPKVVTPRESSSRQFGHSSQIGLKRGQASRSWGRRPQLEKGPLVALSALAQASQVDKSSRREGRAQFFKATGKQRQTRTEAMLVFKRPSTRRT